MVEVRRSVEHLLDDPQRLLSRTNGFHAIAETVQALTHCEIDIPQIILRGCIKLGEILERIYPQSILIRLQCPLTVLKPLFFFGQVEIGISQVVLGCSIGLRQGLCRSDKEGVAA